jgi:hypothetical protein
MYAEHLPLIQAGASDQQWWFGTTLTVARAAAGA